MINIIIQTSFIICLKLKIVLFFNFYGVVLKKLMETGAVNDREHACRRTVTHEKNSLMISKQVEENQRQVSTCKLELDNNMSRSLVMKVLNEGDYSIEPEPSQNPTHSWHNPYIHKKLRFGLPYQQKRSTGQSFLKEIYILLDTSLKLLMFL